MRRDGGITLVEFLLVVALVALASAYLWLSHVRQPGAQSSARELARIITLSRWNAVSAGQASTLMSLDNSRLVRLAGLQCSPAAGDPQTIWTPPVRSSLHWPPMGLAFAPDGRPRRCDGSAVGNTTILIEGPRGDRAAVIVASLGRVRWERR